MEVRALATDQPVSPRKVRLVLQLVRGRPVEEALAMLEFMPQRSARIVATTIKSAVANAENNYELNPDGLVIKSAIAGDARTLKRFRPRSRGRTSPQLKRRSHIEIIVEGEVF
ncbi:MAG: 50S ribosomal protein L22 [Dehalococcoidia bacterium]|jgi:large subunit ribosomal protein L22|nr:50S ribosomal protein L22 [Dehalococcoidia bacterium]|tara:strand:+ start:108 stop:446 length:339 start_codon:yes stop_codon:yes gene_type:complete